MARKKYMPHRSGKIVILSFILAVSAWSLLLYLIKPEEIVNLLGISNSYLAIFIITLIGEISTFTTFTAFAAVVTLAIGGLDIFALSLTAGLGLAIGDALFFYFGRKGRRYFHGRTKIYLEKISARMRKMSRCSVIAFVFLYSALAPFPNSFMILALALSGYSYRYILLPNFLGNATFVFLIIYFSKGF
jgi:membrane protein YqaA with SNARE-associated domain